MNQTRLFIAYSRNDAELLDELKIYLKPTIRKYNLVVWDDQEIDAGATWEQEIKNNLNSADIFLFLISAHSLNSNYFHDKELSHAVDRHKKGEVTIIPIILRSCDWESSKFEKLQVLPQDGKPVISSHWPFKSEAFKNIIDGIKEVLDQRELDRKKQLQEEQQEKIDTAKERERLKKEKEQQQQQAKVELEAKKKLAEAQKQQEELSDWEKTKTDNKITVYQKFIKKYPQSEFNQTAKNNIKLLRNKNKKAKPKNTTPKVTTSSSGIPSSNKPKNNKKEAQVLSQVEREEVLLEKGSIILKRSCYAALPVIGFVLSSLIGDKVELPGILKLLNYPISYIAAIIGTIIIIIFQLINVADEYTLIVKPETEVKETIWGIILTLISFGAMSALGIFLLNRIFSNF